MKNLVHKKSLFSALILWSILVYPVAAFAKDGTKTKLNNRLSKTTNVSKTGGRSGEPGVRVQPPADEIRAVMNPDRIEPGKGTPIILTFPDCKTEWEGKTPVIDATSVALLDQSGIQITDLRPIVVPTAGAVCTAFGLISILRTTPAITYSFKITIMDAPAQEISFRVLGLQGLPPGPIPPGLEPPQVDVMWGLVPSDIVEHNFGRFVAGNFYCLEVVIGNNSGYDLQVSAVGFKPGPVGPYATVVAESHKYMAQKQKSVIEEKLKNIIETCSNDKKYGSYAECVSRESGPVLEEMSAQNAVDVNAAKKLANTSTDASRQAYGNIIPVTGYPMARGTASRGEFWSVRSWTTRLLSLLGPVLTGITPFLSNTADYEHAVNLFSNPVVGGYSNFWPDSFIAKLQRLDDQILREGRIVNNNRQERTTVFIPKKLLGIEKKYRNNPMVVTQALGQMVLIGNLISFLNRVSVTSNPDDGEIRGRPVVSSGFPSEFAIGVPGTIAVTGSELEGSRITTTDSDIKVSETIATRSSASAILTIDPNARLGKHTLLLTTSRGSVQLEITVVARLAAVVATTPQFTNPTQNEPDSQPTSGRPVNQNFNFELTGTDLIGATLKPIRSGNPLSVQINAALSDSTHLRGTITVPRGTAATAPGNPHEFRLTNSNPLSSTQGPLIPVPVIRPDGPTITVQPAFSSENDRRVSLVLPNRGRKFTMTGTNLRYARTVVPSNNARRPTVTCDPFPVPATALSNTEVQCTLTIDPALQISDIQGERFDYEITDDNGQRAPFFITILPVRPITVDPLTGSQQTGSGNPIIMSGQNLQDVRIDPADEDPNWNVNIITRTSATAFTITITPKTTPPTGTGPVTVRFTNFDGSKTGNFVITLSAPTPTPTTSAPE